MSYKISSTEVIADDRTLVNITGASGVYSDFRASTTTLSAINPVLNFNSPIMTLLMTGAATFTETNKDAGKTVVLLLDTSSSNHAPTFSSNIKWKDGATPSWSSYRYWQITLEAINSTLVRGTATGFTATGGPPPSETVTLSGTSGSPITANGNWPLQYNSSWYLTNGFVFRLDGGIYETHLEPTISDPPASVPPGPVESLVDTWCNVSPQSGTYYIRATSVGGTGTPNSLPALNTWTQLNQDTGYLHSDTSAFGSYGARFFTIKVEISTTSNGSNIIATGYYRNNWEGGA